MTATIRVQVDLEVNVSLGPLATVESIPLGKLRKDAMDAAREFTHSAIANEKVAIEALRTNVPPALRAAFRVVSAINAAMPTVTGFSVSD